MDLCLEIIDLSGSLVGPIDEVTLVGLVVAVFLTITSRWRIFLPRFFWFVVPVLLLAVGLVGTGIGLAQPQVVSGILHPLQIDLNWSHAFVSAFDPLRMALMAGGALLMLSACCVACSVSPERRWVR